jgi:hypothetical protein
MADPYIRVSSTVLYSMSMNIDSTVFCIFPQGASDLFPRMYSK